ncbi:MAG TPA: ATP-binding protein, partial [Ktedonosporobacter sp.]|nr:ATP-binding protein [Ktedonosporobacter sp.]
THPLLDPQKSGRVLMDPLMKLVTTALKWSYAQREADVTSHHLKAAAELLTLRRDNIQIIDAENNLLKEKEQEKQESGEEQEKPKPRGRKAKEPKKQPSSDEPENSPPK